MKVDYIALSIPIFFILIGIELFYSFYKKLKYYRLDDSLANLSQGIGSQLVGLFMKGVLFWGYLYLYEHWRLFDIPKSFLVWVLLFLAVDFFYYWFHRMSHQVNALWAAHVVHHQSEEYNLTVALRQSWFQGWFSWVFYLPLAYLGFDPIMFLTMSSFNTLYQFWIHTRTIKNMGFLEYILNTPAHHRVHHGSNAKYIDKNHAGTLIIWDRIFGTFQQEEEEVYYGITKPLESWNPVWANIDYWKDLLQIAKQTPRYTDKIKLFFMPPGWLPGGVSMEKIDISTEIEELIPNKYHTPSNARFIFYALILFIQALALGTVQLFFFHQMSYSFNILLFCYTILCLLNYGALIEQKIWFVKSEYLRYTVGFILIFWTYHLNLDLNIQLIAVLFVHLLNIVYFYKIKSNYNNAKKIPTI